MRDDGMTPTRLRDFQLIDLKYENRRARSEVWLATAPNGRKVALKLVAREIDEDEQAYRDSRLKGEIEASQLYHEHVRRLLSFGSDTDPQENYPSGVDWIAFEWVEGATLQELLARRGSLSPRETRDLARALANGLAVLHREQPPLVHRDVKPANVLLPGDDFRAALLADMGIAWKSGSPRLSYAIGLADSGTPFYMAPEQFLSADVGPSSDQYALALVLWECFTGIVPHTESPERSEIKRARTTPSTIAPLTIAGQSSAAVEAVLRKALSVQADHRYQDISHFLREFYGAGVADGLWDIDIAFGEHPVVGRTVEPRDPSPTPLPRSEFEVAGVWAEQKDHVGRFVGREATLNTCNAWIRGESISPALVIVGPPGQGKSALLSHLADSLGASRGGPLDAKRNGVCLFHMVKSHREPRRILQSLIVQGRTVLGVERDSGLRGSQDDLRAELSGVLEDLVARHGRVTVVVDALDELNTEALSLDFLPPVAPRGVKWVLSSRPDRRILDALRRHFGVVDEEGLHALTVEDCTRLITKELTQDERTVRRVLDVSKLTSLTGGSPLLVRQSIRNLAADIQGAIIEGTTRQVPLDRVPSSLESLFRSICESISGRGVTEVDLADGRVRDCLVQVLTCAQRPLSAEEIRAVLRFSDVKVSRAGLERQLSNVSQFLTEREGRYELYHKGLQDHIREFVLDHDGVRTVHDWFVRWIRALPESIHAETESAQYGRTYIAAHLKARFIAAGSDTEDGQSELLEWFLQVVDLTFVEARIDRREAYELLHDLHETIAEGTKYLERVVDEVQRALCSQILNAGLLVGQLISCLEGSAHTLAEDPSMLAQCLRNVEDAPELRLHAEAIPLKKPALIVVERSVDAPIAGRPQWISRLVCQSVVVPAVTSLIAEARGRGVFSVHNDGVFRTWSGQLQCLSQGQFVATDLWVHGLGDVSARHVLSSNFIDSNAVHIVTDLHGGPVRSIPWPDGVLAMGPTVVVNNLMFVTYASQEGGKLNALYRVDLETSERKLLAEFPLRVWSISATSTLGVVAVVAECLPESDGGYSTNAVRLIDATNGIEIASAPVSIFTSCYLSSAGYLLLSGVRGIQILSVPDLREIGCTDFVDIFMVLHPTLPLAAAFCFGRVSVIDLRSATAIREERWKQCPGRCAVLTAGGSILIGEMTRSGSELKYVDAPLGVWHLPPSFWQPMDGEVVSEAMDDDVVSDSWVANAIRYGPLSGGRSLLVAPGIIVESDDSTHKILRGFTGAVLRGRPAICPIEGAEIAIVSGRVDILDLDERRLSRSLACGNAQVEKLLFRASDGAVFAHWKSSESKRYRPRDLTETLHPVLADILAAGAEIIDLEDASEVISIPALPWPENQQAVEMEGFSRLDTKTGRWTDFFCFQYPSYVGFLSGERFIRAVNDLDLFGHKRTTQILDIASGEVVFEGGDSWSVLVELEDSRMFWGHELDGTTCLFDPRTGEWQPCALNVGRFETPNNDFDFALTTDATLAAWPTESAIVVGDVSSGAILARYPVHDWRGSVTFIDDRTIRAQGNDGKNFVMKLIGVAS
jgi:serine/threonine protein kinase